MSNISVYQSVSVAHNDVWCVEGYDPDFRPGGFLPPDYFLSVNPYGYEDAEEQPNMAAFHDEMFYDPDVVFYLVEGSMCDLQHAFFKQGKLDAEDHFECFNGGLYGLWAVSSTEVLICGMDNGGEDIATTAAHDVGGEFKGQLVARGHHFRFPNDHMPKLARIHDQIEAFRQNKRLAHTTDEFPAPAAKAHKI